MPVPSDFAEFVVELLRPLGDVRAKRMFGGHGIFHAGLMIGLIADDTLYLKVGDRNRPAFESAGMRPFTYSRKNGKQPIVMSYWEAPPQLFDEPDTLRDWARAAHAAAVRSAERRPRRKRAR